MPSNLRCNLRNHAKLKLICNLFINKHLRQYINGATDSIVRCAFEDTA